MYSHSFHTGFLVTSSSDKQVIIRARIDPPSGCPGSARPYHLFATLATWIPLTSGVHAINGENYTVAEHPSSSLPSVGATLVVNSGDLPASPLPYAWNLHVRTMDNTAAPPVLVGEVNLTQLLQLDRGPVSISISGGSIRQIPVTSAQPRFFKISATPVVDPSNKTVALSFYWTLEDVTTASLVPQALSSANTSTVTVSTAFLNAGKMYRVTASATGLPGFAGRSRVASASQSLFTIARDVPIVSAVVEGGALGGSTVMKNNANERLILRARGETSGNEALRFHWKCVSGGFDLSNSSNVRSVVNSSVLVLAPNALTEGVSYIFRASATTQFGLTGSSFVDVVMNLPPSSGLCEVAPSYGIALSTEFSVSCRQWEDEDVPLKYKYQSMLVYQSGGESKRSQLTDLCDFRLLDTINTKLPGGDSGNVTITAIISDSLGATTVSSAMTVSLAVGALNVEDSLSDIGQRLGQGDVESFAVLVSGAVAILNSESALVIENSTRLNSNSSGGGGGGGGGGGSASEAAESATVTVQRKVRGDLLGKISSLVQEDSSDEYAAISTPVSLIEAVTSTPNPDDLTSSMRSLAMRMIKNVTLNPRNDFSNRTVTSTVTAIDNILQSSSGTSVSVDPKAKSRLGMQIEATVVALGSGIVKEAAEGENAIEIDVGDVNIVAQKVGADSLAGKVYSNSYNSVFNLSQSLAIPSGSRSSRVSMTTLRESPYPSPNQSSSVRAQPKAALIIAGVEVGNRSSGFNNSVPRSDPYIIEIPYNLTTAQMQDSSPQCQFWDKRRRRWSDEGVSTMGVYKDQRGKRLVCASTHLTAFSSSLEFKISVNTISAEDVTLEAFSTSNPAFVLCVVVLSILASAVVLGGQVDKAKSRSSSMEHFWTKYNENFHLRFTERSLRNFRKRLRWGMRQKHPWLSVLFHLPGDFMNTVKRSMILGALLFNSMAVLMLLRGQAQSVPLLSGESSAMLVAVIFSFPTPIFAVRIFMRPIPGHLHIKGDAIVSQKGCLAAFFAFFAALILEEIEPEDNDENDDGFNEAALAGANAAAMFQEPARNGERRKKYVFIGSLLSGRREKVKREYSPSSSLQRLPGERLAAFQKQQKSKKLDMKISNRRFTRLNSIRWGGSTMELTSSVLGHELSEKEDKKGCCGEPIRRGDDPKLKNSGYTYRDVFGLCALATIILGCFFIICVLSNKGGSNRWTPDSLTMFCEDISLRILTILIIEMFFFLPTNPRVWCVQTVRSQIEKYNDGYNVEVDLQLSGLDGVVLDESHKVSQLSPSSQMQKFGLARGAKAIAINGTLLHPDEDASALIQKSLRNKSHYWMTVLKRGSWKPLKEVWLNRSDNGLAINSQLRVAKVVKETEAEHMEIRKGWRILYVNDEPVRTLLDATRAFHVAARVGLTYRLVFRTRCERKSQFISDETDSESDDEEILEGKVLFQPSPTQQSVGSLAFEKDNMSSMSLAL
eukprot:jgi/Bigna1/134157/aug1.24_g8865